MERQSTRLETCNSRIHREAPASPPSHPRALSSDEESGCCNFVKNFSCPHKKHVEAGPSTTDLGDFQNPRRLRQGSEYPNIATALTKAGTSLCGVASPFSEGFIDSLRLGKLPYRAPESRQPGEYRGVVFTKASNMASNSNKSPNAAGPLFDASLDEDESVFGTPVVVCQAEALSITRATPTLRRVGQLPERLSNASSANGAESSTSKQENISQLHPLELSPSMSPLSASMSSWTSPPSTPKSAKALHVSFEDGIKDDEVSSPRLDTECLTVDELVVRNARAAAHGELFRLLQKTCLSNPDRFVHEIPKRMSKRRDRLVVHESSAFFWNWLHENTCINFSSDPAHEIRLRIMEKLFRKIWRHAFLRLPEDGEKVSQAQIISGVRDLAQNLSEYFVIFEKEPMGEDHSKLHRDFTRLAFAAYDLRGLLVPTEQFKFSFYLPLYSKHSSRKLEWLRNRVNILDTLGATHRSDESSDILYMSLYGGVVRTGRKTVKNGKTTVNNLSVLECRAVGVAWRPAEGELLSPWQNRLTAEEMQEIARRRAKSLEKALTETKDDAEAGA